MDQTHHTRIDEKHAHPAHEQDQAGYGYDHSPQTHRHPRDHDEHASRAGYGERVDRVPHASPNGEPDACQDCAPCPEQRAHHRDAEDDGASDDRTRTPGRNE